MKGTRFGEWRGTSMLLAVGDRVFAEVFCSHVKGLRKDTGLAWEEFRKLVTYQVGREDKVKLWRNRRNGEDTIESSFLVIFLLAMDKEVLVSNYLVNHGIGVHWHIRLRRPV